MQLSAFALLALTLQSSGDRSAERPNVVIILADDLGWSDVGCFGNEFNETPHIDALSRGGMRFTQAYAAAPVCSPDRAALLTGLAPARIGIVDYLRPNSSIALSTDHVTLAERFRDAGYSTGMIGKWHLSGYEYHEAEHEVRPEDHGFDWTFGCEVKGVGNGANFWPYVFRDQPIRWLDIPDNRFGDGEYLVDRMNAEAVDFVERHADRPFLLFLSHYAVHTILNGRPDLVEKYNRKHPPGPSMRENCYLCRDAGHEGDVLHHWAGDHNPHLAAMLESIDDGVGLLMAALEEHGLAEDTIVLFASDNGGETNVTSNAPLRGGKSQLYEGGIRVPFVVHWPARVPAGTVCEHPTSAIDVMPTLLDAADIRTDDAVRFHGVSMMTSWSDPGTAPEREALYWHYPLDQPHFLGGRSAGAVRAGDWKLIQFFDTDRVELYDLGEDLGEERDLAAAHPEIVAELSTQLEFWRMQVGARTPSAPVLARAGAAQFEESFEPGLVSERWFVRGAWEIDEGILRRNELPGENQRVFLKNARYGDVVIRFDFRFDGAEELRLMTGTPGHYNAVIHIHPDHFFVQTADDKSVPFFPTIQGECACEFQRDQWYTMTVEIVGDEIIAHVDREHFVIGRHPILDRERDYFAFQVDKPSASFDNVSIFSARQNDEWEGRRPEVVSNQAARPRIPRPPAERFRILRDNTRDRLYRSSEEFRGLVLAIEECKTAEAERFPEVFRTTKEARREIDAERQRLSRDDARYQTLVRQLNESRTAERDLLHERQPSLRELPTFQYEAAVERLRSDLRTDGEYRAILEKRAETQAALESAYPRLFTTDEQIAAERRAARQRVEDEPEFLEAIRATAEAVQAEREALFEAEPELRRLNAMLHE